MPRVTYITGKKPEKPNYLAAVFSAYRKANNITSEDVAERVGCTPQNARVQMAKPGSEWKIGHLVQYCEATGVPVMEALEAAVK